MLGLGNLLLSDDGVGLRLLEEMSSSRAAAWGDQVEFLDGGTQGLGLVAEIAGRRGVVILDAVGAGDDPGTVHFLRSLRSAPGVLNAEPSEAGTSVFGAGRGDFRSTTAHESNARELIATVALLGDSPDELVVVGVEPEQVHTGIGLSASVERAVGTATQRAAEVVEKMLESGAGDRF